MSFKKTLRVASGILSVVLMSPVVGTTTLGHPQNIVTLEITRTNQRHGVIYSYLHLQVGSSVYEFNAIENAKYAIPVGTYVTTLELSRRFQRKVPRLQVLNRTYIEIHPAVNAYRLLGCIGVSSEDFETLITLLPPTDAFQVVVAYEISD